MTARLTRIPVRTLAGVPGADVTTHRFETEDGLTLSLLRFCREQAGDVVLVVHGLTTSSDMFIMPEHRNLVSFLLDNGFTDVWTLDGRMSNRHQYNDGERPYTLDDVARYDYAPALRVIREVAGDRAVHVVSHCLGAVSVLMSVFGGVDGVAGRVRSVIANSAGLTPRVPAWSQVKLAMAPVLLKDLLRLPSIGPGWAAEPLLSRAGLLARVVRLGHPECDEPACHMLSMMWGSGRPALYHHANLLAQTHERSEDLYGPTGFEYYRHMHKMVRAGRAVRYDRRRHPDLPADYLAGAAEVRTPVLLTTGLVNDVFADSNQVCYQRLEAVAPGRHELEVFDGYGHQDVFMGRHAARDVFPRMLDFLKRQAD
ncbi:MAG: hypothetical protein ACRDQB_02360 [Thermocrispum sp.]